LQSSLKADPMGLNSGILLLVTIRCQAIMNWKHTLARKAPFHGGLTPTEVHRRHRYFVPFPGADRDASNRSANHVASNCAGCFLRYVRRRNICASTLIRCYLASGMLQNQARRKRPSVHERSNVSTGRASANRTQSLKRDNGHLSILNVGRVYSQRCRNRRLDGV
jgi:hypothetical protein